MTEGPPFELLTAWQPRLADYWRAPDEPTLHRLGRELNCPVRFISHRANSAKDYELAVFQEQVVPTRFDHWHDRFNAAMWLLWPRSKLALNRAHVADLGNSNRRRRSRRRDALTLLDEVGVIIVSTDSATPELNRRHQWQTLFWERRQHWLSGQTRALLIGHGLAEQLLTPYLGLTGKALHLPLSGDWLRLPPGDFQRMVDGQLAELIGRKLSSPSELSPLPVLGIPQWHDDNARPEFYANRDYFRPKLTGR